MLMVEISIDSRGKKRWISLSTGGSKHFVYTSKYDLDLAAEGVVLRNTARVNEWARRTLDGWVKF